MKNVPISESEQSLTDDLTAALRPRMERLLQDMAGLLAATTNSHPFGPTEFALRDLVHAASADFMETALREKKTAIRERL